jgi:hypothetical protein
LLASGNTQSQGEQPPKQQKESSGPQSNSAAVDTAGSDDWLREFDGLIAPYDNEITAISTVFIALFTIVLGITSIYQGRQTAKALKLAQDEFISTHRPKLILREAFALYDAPGKPVDVLYVITNKGGSKGTIIQSALEVQFYSQLPGNVLLTPFSLGKQTIDGGTHDWSFEAGQSRQFHYVAKGEPWPPRVDIGTQGAALFFSGHFVYADFRGIQRATAFRRIYDVGRERFYRYREPGHEEDEEYNYTD